MVRKVIVKGSLLAGNKLREKAKRCNVQNLSDQVSNLTREQSDIRYRYSDLRDEVMNLKEKNSRQAQTVWAAMAGLLLSFVIKYFIEG